MNPEFDIILYKKYNKDLQDKTDEELTIKGLLNIYQRYKQK